MNGSISIVTSVVADIADRLDAVAVEVENMQPAGNEVFLGADDVQARIDDLVDGLASLGTDLSAEIDALRSEAVQIRDDFLDLDRRIAATVDASSLGGTGIGAEGVGGTY